MKNSSVKLPMLTKNSKHLRETSAHDSSPLILFNYKKQKYLVTFAYKNKTIVTSVYVVNVETVSNLNSLVSFKICPLNKKRRFVTSNWIYSLWKNRSIKLPFVTWNEISLHELLQNTKLISFITSHHYTETTQCILYVYYATVTIPSKPD